MKKILIIEDNDIIRKQIASILTYENFLVIEANNGRTGLEIAKEQKPDLIICDILMPEVNGYQVISNLNNEDSFSEVPFIFLTAKTSKEDFRKGMELGADDYLTKPFTRQELISAVKTRLEKKEKIKNINQEKISLLTNELELEKELSQIDPLTGIANRRGFLQRAEAELNRAKRHKYPVSLVYFDLDNFKNVNDSLGHDVGDMVLKKVCECTINNIRPTDIFSRFGGDEFIIMLPEADSEISLRIMNRIRDLLLEIMAENKWSITLSIGIITFNCLDLSISHMINLADNYMYQAKTSGKNKIITDIVN